MNILQVKIQIIRAKKKPSNSEFFTNEDSEPALSVI